jgi:hypothetical protein
MSGSNGMRRPRRPRIELVSGGVSDTEAAAIVGALAQFLAETAPAPRLPRPQSRWQRAALEEGIAARQLTAGGWGKAPG